MSNVLFPVDFKAHRQNLVRIVQIITKLECIQEEQQTQNIPRPKKPYFSFKFTTPATKYGDDDARNVSDNLGNSTTTWNSGGQRRLSCSFHCYANSKDEAYSYMGLLQSSFDLQTIQEDLRKVGIAVWMIGAAQDLSLLLNTGTEGRTQMDVQFGIAANLTETLGEIDKVGIQSTIELDSSNINDDYDVSD